jgi:leader peptidase (prepilin peptidase)/N-methyltransferase
MYGAGFALSLGLTAASFIDLEHMYIPDTISYGATVLGLATISFRDVGIIDAIVSSIGAFLLIWLVFGVGYKALRGRTGMGLGDAKLLMVAGAWFGWRGAIFALLAGSVQGTIAVIGTLLVKGKVDEPDTVEQERRAILDEIAAIQDPTERQKALDETDKDPIFEETSGGLSQVRIAFGPFLALATLEYLLLRPEIIEVYDRWISL